MQERTKLERRRAVKGEEMTDFREAEEGKKAET